MDHMLFWLNLVIYTIPSAHQRVKFCIKQHLRWFLHIEFSHHLMLLIHVWQDYIWLHLTDVAVIDVYFYGVISALLKWDSIANGLTFPICNSLLCELTFLLISVQDAFCVNLPVQIDTWLAVAKSCPLPRLQQFRWTIAADSEVVIRLRFRSEELGQYDQTLNFEIMGTRRRYQLYCRGICAFPTISREPRYVLVLVFVSVLSKHCY